MSSWPELGPGLNDFGGDWSRYQEACYKAYYQDFYNTRPVWPVGDVRFAIKKQPMMDGMCGTFWHIVTEGEDEDNRLPALDRLERIGWPRQILDGFAALYPAQGSNDVVWWKNERRRQARYVLALADFSYVVIVDDRGEYVLLWTAYPVDQPHRRKKLSKEYAAYWAARAGTGGP